MMRRNIRYLAIIITFITPPLMANQNIDHNNLAAVFAQKTDSDKEQTLLKQYSQSLYDFLKLTHNFMFQNNSDTAILEAYTEFNNLLTIFNELLRLNMISFIQRLSTLQQETKFSMNSLASTLTFKPDHFTSTLLKAPSKNLLENDRFIEGLILFYFHGPSNLLELIQKMAPEHRPQFLQILKNIADSFAQTVQLLTLTPAEAAQVNSTEQTPAKYKQGLADLVKILRMVEKEIKQVLKDLQPSTVTVVSGPAVTPAHSAPIVKNTHRIKRSRIRRGRSRPRRAR